MLLRLRQACDHPLLVRGLDSISFGRSSIELAKKLPREKQTCLLNCLEASLAICGICNVCSRSFPAYVFSTLFSLSATSILERIFLDFSFNDLLPGVCWNSYLKL